MTTATATSHANEVDLRHDWRFAELVMRTRMEPDLAATYRENPAGALASFGIELEPGAKAPALPGEAPSGEPATGEITLVLDRSADAVPYPCCVA